MKIIGIIPARYGSTRFPGKPLALIHGKTMIQRVFERASSASSLSLVTVATDDQRIYDHVVSFGGQAVMTSSSHPSGTDRCAEALHLQLDNYDVVINIQGDEPYIYPQQIDLLAACFTDDRIEIGTLVKQLSSADELQNPNIPKVVRDKNGYALYFSRLPVPFCKPGEIEKALTGKIYFKHIGIYGYRSTVLPRLSALPPGSLEKCESLEQLRWLENGYRIMTAISNHENLAVDAPEDIAIIEKRFSFSD